MTTTMQRLVVFLIALGLGLALPRALAEEAVGLLRVEITGLTEASGSVFIAVYDSKSTWLGDEAVMTREIVIADALDGEVVVTELELPVGEYAFSIFHDQNGNGELDTNFIGMPREPIAMSNNVRAKFGPPKYADARFMLDLEPQIQRVIIVTL